MPHWAIKLLISEFSSYFQASENGKLFIKMFLIPKALMFFVKL